MKIYTSYFYQIRFFKPYMIPISTCLSDPKWFYILEKVPGHSSRHLPYIDKNGVINGLRAELLAPGAGCEGDCRGPEYCATKDPSTCNFLRHYQEQLNTLDCKALITHCEEFARDWQTYHCPDQEPLLVFIVYETPSNPCSERRVLQEWLRNNGYEVEELDPKNV